MIKALGQAGDGRPLVVLGLSGENVTQLVAGEPILLDLAELGLPAMLVTIIYGRTEGDIAHDLEQFNHRARTAWAD